MVKKISITLLSALLLCFSAFSQSLEEQQKKRDLIERDIAILRKQIDKNSTRTEQALSALTLTQAQKQSRQKLVRESDKSIRSLNVQIDATKSEIHRQQTVLDTLQAHFNRLVMGAYKNRDVKMWYMYILSSDNMAQAFRRFAYFKGLSAQINSQAVQIRQTRSELEAKRQELQRLRDEEKALYAQRQKELDDIKKDEQQQQKLVNSLKRDSKSYSKALKAKQEEMRAIDKKISQMLASARNSDGKKKNTQADLTLSKTFESNKGKLPWPVDGPVAEHFGPYQNKELRLSLYNNGINIACEPSSSVKAVFDGVVSNVMLAPGYGNCILIQHGNYYTSYCKVKTSYVHQGDKVRTGQVIGEVATIMGKTQLYFLVWKKKYLDPETWLRAR